jgi:glutamyl-tRNA reductase
MGVSPGWLQRLAVVATSYRQVGFGRLGSFSISPDSTDELQTLKAELGAAEFVFLSTCNRVECYLVMPSGTAPDAAQLQAKVSDFFARRGAALDDKTFFAATGRQAARHLLKVVSSLDSLVLGETEIAGQAKRCLDRAKAAGLCGEHLPGLFDFATACSRRIRSETAISSIPVSVATIALKKVRKHFGKVGPGVTVLVGVGDMCRKVAQALTGTPGKVIVVNRTLSRAEAFCAKYGGVAMSLEAFKANPPGWIDLLFTTPQTSRPPSALAGRPESPTR